MSHDSNPLSCIHGTRAGSPPRQELGAKFGGDRDYKYFFTRLLAQRAIERLPGMMRRAGLGPDRCVIVDSEVLFSADEEPSTLAICRAEATEVTEAGDDAELRRELANELGEFDVAHTRYLRSPLLQAIAGEGRVLVDTVDTDLLFIAMLQSTMPGFPVDVRVRCTLTGAEKPADFDFDPVHAAAVVQETLGADGVAKLVEAFVLSGSDFCAGVPGVGNRVFMDKCIAARLADPGRVFRDECTQSILRGTKRGSAKMAGPPERQHACVAAQCDRAKYVLEYWRCASGEVLVALTDACRHSGYRDELVPSPLRRGALRV